MVTLNQYRPFLYYFQSTKICNKTEFKKYIYNPFLKIFQEYGNTIELSFNPKCITENVPIQVGFVVLQYAKLRMLKIYYDCLRQYLYWDDFQLIQMDKDSFYYAISKDEYNKLQKIEGWFLSNNTKLVDIGIPTKITKSLYENYTPGLFKLEYEGIEMIALTQKTYILDTNLGKYKTAAKGAQKHINSLIIKEYKNALFDNSIISGTNKGFRMHDGQMSTYEQNKTILTSQYSKRVIIDNIYTRPFMPSEIDSEIKITSRKTKSNQSKFKPTNIWIFDKKNK